MNRFQMQPPREDSVNTLIKDGIKLAIFVGGAIYCPELLEASLKAKARAARRKRKSPNSFDLFRSRLAQVGASQPPVIEGARVDLLPAKPKGRPEKKFTSKELEGYKLYESDRAKGVPANKIKWNPIFKVGLKNLELEENAGETPAKKAMRRNFKNRYEKHNLEW
jgi:hypothetical protein